MFHEAGMLKWEMKQATFDASLPPVQNGTVPSMLMLEDVTCAFEHVFVPVACA